MESEALNNVGTCDCSKHSPSTRCEGGVISNSQNKPFRHTYTHTHTHHTHIHTHTTHTHTHTSRITPPDNHGREEEDKTEKQALT